MDMKKILLFSLVLLLFITGCGTNKKTLVCTSVAKECSYEAVSESEIGEEIQVCDDAYGDITITFNYKSDESWDSGEEVTLVYKDKSTDEFFDKMSNECSLSQDCDIDRINGQIKIVQKINSKYYEMKDYDSMKKMMIDMGYECK